MEIDQNSIRSLGKIIEGHLPKTSTDAPEEWQGKVVGRSTRVSDVHAMSIYFACELGPDMLGASASQDEPNELSKSLMNGRMALSKLSGPDRQRLLIAVDPSRNQNDCFGRIDQLIDELADLEDAARSLRFKRMKGERASGKRNWRAAAIAFAAGSVWQRVNGEDSVPKAVNHDAPSAFGKFLNDVLKWAGEKSSAMTALRSFMEWRSSQQ